MNEVDEPRYTIVKERLIPKPDGDANWVIVWKSITDGSTIRRRMNDDEYQACVAGDRSEKPLWRRTQIDPIGEAERG